MDYGIIQQYLEGKLDPKRMHELEKQALEDPFLAEALEGYEQSDIPAGTHLSLLQRQLEEHIAQQSENKRVFYFTWQRLSVAAAAGLLFVSACILFWMKGYKQENRLSSREKHVEVRLTPHDSLEITRDNISPSPSPGEEDARKNPEPPRVMKKAERTAAEPGFQSAKLRRKSESISSRTATDSARLVILYDSGVKAEDSLKNNNAVAALVKPAAGIKDAAPASVSSVLAGKVMGIAAEGKKPHAISGKVISKDDGSPLPGVVVTMAGTRKASVTNASGEFALADSTEGRITFTSLGYKTEMKNAEPGQSMVVELEPSSNSLNEVVVVGYGAQKKADMVGSVSKVSDGPEPAGGWSKYREYLRNNIRLSAGDLKQGRVIVGFTVDSLERPVNFKIIEGLNEACNQEAIRLIKEGPSWKSGGPGKNEARVTVRFSKQTE